MPADDRAPFQTPTLLGSEILMLLVDGSWSMSTPKSRPKIAELETALKDFVRDDLPSLPEMHDKCELAVGIFRGKGSAETGQPVVDWLELAPDRAIHPFYPLRNGIAIPTLFADGATPLADAVIEAVEALRRRTDTPGVTTPHKPNVFLLTDGEPTRGQRIPAAAALLRESAFRQDGERPEFLFVAIGTDDANIVKLEELAPLASYKLKNVSLREILKFVTKTVSKVTADPNPGVSPYDKIRTIVESLPDDFR